MSWIFGQIVKQRNQSADLPKAISENILFSFHNKNLSIAAGGAILIIFSFLKIPIRPFLLLELALKIMLELIVSLRSMIGKLT